MRTYQSVVILKPDLDDTQVDQTHEKISQFIAKNGGEVVKTEKWGKKRLAYRVRKNRFGIYLNIYHTNDPAKMASLENEYRLYDPIIKHLIVHLEKDEWDWAMGKAAAEAAKTEGQGAGPDDAKEGAEEAEGEAS
ncbi:MAG: 30S ribosomal protein S6 [Nitrospinae bacterium]|nr:30S ribosomal protein S6 [Nitrospinota bacterium]